MSASWWFYVREGQQHSVPSLADLAAAFDRGEIEGSTLVWRQGLSEWMPARTVPELVSHLGDGSKPPPLPPPPASPPAARTEPPPGPSPKRRRPSFGAIPRGPVQVSGPAAAAAGPEPGQKSSSAVSGELAPDSQTWQLASADFPQIVYDLQSARATGSLVAEADGVRKTVTVHEGRIVFAASTDPDDRLGELMLRMGKITLSQYLAAGRAIGPGRRLGTLLVEQGAITPAALVRRVIEQVREILYSLFQWTSGTCRLEPPAPGSDDETITLRLSTPDIIVEGIRRIPAWSRIMKGVGGPEARYARRPDWEAAARGVKELSEPARAFLSDFQDGRAVEEICGEGREPSSFETCQLIWAFRVIGVLERLSD
jgi:hypothetical protein